MVPTRPLDVVLLVESETVHHRRFSDALEQRGHRVSLVAPGADGSLLGNRRSGARPDVVLAGPLPRLAEVALDAFSAPLVAVSWGSDLLRDVPGDSDLVGRTRAVLAAAVAVIVDCVSVEEAAVGLGADPGSVYRFPWGIDLARHPFRELPGGPVRVISLRSLARSYEVGTLIRAVERVPGLQADIAGDGPQTAELQALASALGIADRVRFLGRMPEEEIPELLASHHVHVSTSPTDGSSISLLQALATGRPSVVVDNPSNREWLEDGVTGWLVPRGDVGALADRLSAIVARPAQLASMATRGRAVAEERADWGANQQVLWRAVEDAAGSATWS